MIKQRKYKNRTDLLFDFLSGSKRYFAVSMLFALFVAFLDFVNPKIMAFTVDVILGGDQDKIPGFFYALFSDTDLNEKMDFIRDRLYLVAAAVIVGALLRLVCRYFFQLLNAVGEEGVVRRMRDMLYGHIIMLPSEWHSANKTGDIIQRCTSDVDTVRIFLSEQLVQLVRVIMLIILAMYFMIRINLPLALFAVVFVPIIIIYSVMFYGKVGESFYHVDVMEGRLSAMVQENLTGIRVVRAFGREAYEKKRFVDYNETYMGTWKRLMKLLAIFWSIGDFVSGLQVLLIVSVGAVFCVRGSLSAGEYIEFITYNALLVWPIRMLGRVISDMSKAGISIDRILYIMNSGIEEDPADACEVPMDQDIEFKNVSFSYGDDQEETLKDICFTIHAGETVGILGGTGSGKSTLVALLDRLFDLKDEEGLITIGGVDIRKIRLKYLRQNVGMVLQEPYLFSGTLAENIAITEDHISMKDIRRAARIAALDDTVSKFAKGYETYVGERGVTLSGGQKQRTAIAQMLVRRPPIMIFDDSLSAVDAKTDVAIRQKLYEEAKGTTTLIIAHRISTLMQADRIIVLDKGRIAECGTHDELMKAGGIYAKTYRLQQTGGVE